MRIYARLCWPLQRWLYRSGHEPGAKTLVGEIANLFTTDGPQALVENDGIIVSGALLFPGQQERASLFAGTDPPRPVLMAFEHARDGPRSRFDAHRRHPELIRDLPGIGMILGSKDNPRREAFEHRLRGIHPVDLPQLRGRVDDERNAH